jgi:hypothetical protein
MGQNIFLEVMYEGDKFDTAALRSQDKRSKRHSCLTGPLLLTSFLNFDIIEERAIIRRVQFIWSLDKCCDSKHIPENTANQMTHRAAWKCVKKLKGQNVGTLADLVLTYMHGSCIVQGNFGSGSRDERDHRSRVALCFSTLTATRLARNDKSPVYYLP